MEQTAQSTPVQFLKGKLVYLRPLEKADMALFRVWTNDPEIRGLTGEVTPTSDGETEEWFEKTQSSETRIWFAVVRAQDNRVIGETGLLRMFHPWRTTDLSIIIGDASARGQGYGREAIDLMLEYAFGYLNFHRVSIGVVGFNHAALRFYEQVGFKREGIQRDGYFYNRAYSDFVMMSILDHEFYALHPKP